MSLNSVREDVGDTSASADQRVVGVRDLRDHVFPCCKATRSAAPLRQEPECVSLCFQCNCVKKKAPCAMGSQLRKIGRVWGSMMIHVIS